MSAQNLAIVSRQTNTQCWAPNVFSNGDIDLIVPYQTLTQTLIEKYEDCFKGRVLPKSKSEPASLVSLEKEDTRPSSFVAPSADFLQVSSISPSKAFIGADLGGGEDRDSAKKRKRLDMALFEPPSPVVKPGEDSPAKRVRLCF